MEKRKCSMESVGVRDMNNLAFFKGKKVFLTGHTGFKGSWLSRILILSGAEVTGYALEAPVEVAVDAAVELEPPQAVRARAAAGRALRN